MAPSHRLSFERPIYELQEQLEQLLDEVPETTDLIIVEPRPDKRTSYYKKLQKQTEFKSY